MWYRRMRRIWVMSLSDNARKRVAEVKGQYNLRLLREAEEAAIERERVYGRPSPRKLREHNLPRWIQDNPELLARVRMVLRKE